MSQDHQTHWSATTVFLILFKLLAAFAPLIWRTAPDIARAVPPPPRMADTVTAVGRTFDDTVGDTPSMGRVVVDRAPDIATQAVDLIAPDDDDRDAP